MIESIEMTRKLTFAVAWVRSNKESLVALRIRWVPRRRRALECGRKGGGSKKYKKKYKQTTKG